VAEWEAGFASVPWLVGVSLTGPTVEWLRDRFFGSAPALLSLGAALDTQRDTELVTTGSLPESHGAPLLKAKR
jgi:hypothetical protein